MTLLASKITAALVARLQTCRVANGYSTDLGATVLPGVQRGGKVQASCVFLTPGRVSEIQDEYGTESFTRTYDINGFCDTTEYAAVAECDLVDLIAWDLRRCLWATDATLAALIRDLRIVTETPGYREEGGSLVGCGLTVEVDYAINRSDPNTAV